jgi:uncharacterized protein YkwD
VEQKLPGRLAMEDFDHPPSRSWRASIVPAAACACLVAQALAQPVPQEPRLDEAERHVVERSNDLRRAHGQAPTTPTPALTASAREFAAYMARTDRYAHDADGRQPAQRASARGYEHCMVSENIAYQFSSAGFGSLELARGFVQGWIDSPGHRRNLLAPEATDTGVAIARSARSGRYYAVQMFGRPATLSVRFALSNRSASALRYTIDGQPYVLNRGQTRWHEQCRTPTVQVKLPGKDMPVGLQPADGAHYRLEAGSSGLQSVGG